MSQLNLDILVRLAVSALLGGIIGFERERHNRWAGFRTHILVSVGSCLIMITSVEMARLYPDSADPGRLAAQVVSGIGFLAAGTILHSASRVRGLTTAATLWTMAGVGLATGLGLYTAAVAATILTFIVLAFFGRWQNAIRRSRYSERWIIDLDIPQIEEYNYTLFTALENFSIVINSIKIDRADNLNKITIDMQVPFGFDESVLLSDLQSKVRAVSASIKKC